jgi:hypothetical protein
VPQSVVSIIANPAIFAMSVKALAQSGRGVDDIDEHGGIVDEFIAPGRENATRGTRKMLTRSNDNCRKTRLENLNLSTDWGKGDF